MYLSSEGKNAIFMSSTVCSLFCGQFNFMLNTDDKKRQKRKLYLTGDTPLTECYRMDLFPPKSQDRRKDKLTFLIKEGYQNFVPDLRVCGIIPPLPTYCHGVCQIYLVASAC